MGYQRNKHDWCITNKIVNDRQCTILLHVDNMKMSHVDPEIVTSAPSGIDAEYGKIANRTIAQGKIQKYLRMTIDYSSPGKLIFSMVDYILKMLDDIPEYMKG